MDIRAEKLAKARKKLKDHQEKKIVTNLKSEHTVQLEHTTLTQQAVSDNIKNNNDHINEDCTLTYNGKEEDKNCYQEMKSESDINVTEILISTRNNLELQISDLNGKLAHLEYLHGLELNNHNITKQKLLQLESELSDIKTKYSTAVQNNASKDETNKELNNVIQSLKDENNNLCEQLEFTKSMLTTKELENANLQNQIASHQNQEHLLQLQIQQLSSDSPLLMQDLKCTDETEDDLYQEIPFLKQKIDTLEKDKEHIQSHYEHYVSELNKQLQSEMLKSEKLFRDTQMLSDRERTLIDQISDLEIRLQNYNIRNKSQMCKHDPDIDIKYEEIKAQFEEVNKKFSELQALYKESIEKIRILQQEKENVSNNEHICNHDNVDITKLSADISSDKLAAQRATEQNKKLKIDIEGLEQVIVKMGKDKLELTEKWMHEKQLNKGLALKLAEVEESSKIMQSQLKAKDDEMIRLQNEYRLVQQNYEKIVQELNDIKAKIDTVENDRIFNQENESNHVNSKVEHTEMPHSTLPEINTNTNDEMRIQKEDAMIKLQERFLNIMDEVANLSDEKHRLEHIILQLQNETDTICEYVALYQQQRSLLKRREEERSNQLKIFQTECDKLKRQLEELSDLLLRFAADEQLASYLKEETRCNDLARVKELLQKLQNCSLINPKFKNLDLNVFYPCSCCSGKLIDI